MKMMKRVVSVVLLLAAATAWTAQETPTPTAEQQLVASVGRTPNQVIDYFERRDPATSADYYTLSLAYYAKADFRSALDYANRALSLQTVPVAQSICFHLVTQCHGALGHFDHAAESALQGLRVNPKSKELAALRLAYTTQVGDQLSLMAAKEHLMQLEGVYDKEPKLEPMTTVLVIVAIVCTTEIAVAWIAAHAEHKEVGLEISKSLIPLLELGKLAGLLLPTSVPTPIKAASS